MSLHKLNLIFVIDDDYDDHVDDVFVRTFIRSFVRSFMMVIIQFNSLSWDYYKVKIIKVQMKCKEKTRWEIKYRI